MERHHQYRKNIYRFKNNIFFHLENAKPHIAFTTNAWLCSKRVQEMNWLKLAKEEKANDKKVYNAE